MLLLGFVSTFSLLVLTDKPWTSGHELITADCCNDKVKASWPYTHRTRTVRQKPHLALTKLWATHAHSTLYSCQLRGDLQAQFSSSINAREHSQVAYSSVIFRQFCLPSLCTHAIAAVLESWARQHNVQKTCSRYICPHSSHWTTNTLQSLKYACW